MSKKKEVSVACKLTMKNRIYLEMLGYLDGRTGRKPDKSSPKVSNLINNLLTQMLEKGKGYKKDVSSPNELKIAYLNFQRKIKTKEQERVGDELKNIAIQLKEESEC